MQMRGAWHWIATIALGCLTAACLQPLHAPPSATSTAQLAHVQVRPIEGWIGHQLKNDLDFFFKGGTPGVTPLYELRIKTQETTSASLVDVTTGRAQAATLNGEIIYELVDMSTGKLITAGKTFASTAFNRSAQSFANQRAQRDAEARLARTFAERLRGLTASALKSPFSQTPLTPSLTLNPDRKEKNPGDET
jgi:LPS-assembly lipoprotein